MARVGNAACSGCRVGRAVVFGPLLAVLWVWRVALCSCWSSAAWLLGLRHLRWPAGSFASWCPRPDCPRVLVWPHLVLLWEPGCRLPLAELGWRLSRVVSGSLVVCYPRGAGLAVLACCFLAAFPGQARLWHGSLLHAGRAPGVGWTVRLRLYGERPP